MAGPSLAIRSQCPNATPANDGLMTAKQASQAAKVAVDNVDLYLSVSGNDGNDGTTPGTAVATWARILELVPGMWAGYCRIHVGPGTFQLLGGMNPMGNPIGPNGTPLVIMGEVTQLQVLTATAAGSLNLITDSGAGMTADAYIGAAVTCLTGGNAGRRFMCARNTTTTLQLNGNLGVAIGIGDTFSIERPVSILNYTATPGIDCLFAYRQIAFKDMQFTLGTASRVVFNTCIIAACENVVFGPSSSTLWFNFLQSTALFGGLNTPWVRESDNPFSLLRLNCGTYFTGGIIQMNNSVLTLAPMVTQNATISVNCAFFPGATNSWSKGGSWTATANSYMAFNPNGALGTVFDACPIVASSAVLRANLLTCNNSAGAAISIDSRGVAVLTTVAGTGNATYGVVLASMSQLSATASTVTGTTGDVLVGAVAKTYGALPYSEVDASGPTLNRAQ